MELKKTIRRVAFNTKVWLIKVGSKLKEKLIFISRKTGKAIKAIAFFVRKFTVGIFRAIGLILDDIILLAGIACVSYGAFLIFEPAGYIVLGFCLFGLAYLVAKKRAVRR